MPAVIAWMIASIPWWAWGPNLGACFNEIPGPRCDFNGDGLVNSTDFFDFLAALFSENPRADYNGDRVFDTRDLTLFTSTCGTP